MRSTYAFGVVIMSDADKSYVGMGHLVCPVCHEKHGESVLLDKRLRNTLTRNTFLGYELCPNHLKMSEEYVALVETTGRPRRDSNAQFTGQTAHLSWAVADQIFDVEMNRNYPFVFVEVGVIAKLQALTQGGSQPE